MALPLSMAGTRLAFCAGLLFSCAALTGCMGSATIRYAAPPSATPTNSATLVGSHVARNDFNDSYACVLVIDGTQVADERHRMCKFVADQSFLVPPGRHKISIGFAEESGHTTWGQSKPIEVDLQAGKTYRVQRQAVSNDMVQVWLADDSNEPVGAVTVFDSANPHDHHDTAFMAGSGVGHPSEKHKLFVFADFGERAQPFETAFTQTFKGLADACQVEAEFLLVPHRVGLSLEAPPAPPSPAEVSSHFSASGADGLLRVKTTNWNGSASQSANFAEPIRGGQYTLAVSLAKGIQGPAEWSATMVQDVSGNTGGEQLAKAIVRRLAVLGGLPHCPDTLLR